MSFMVFPSLLFITFYIAIPGALAVSRSGLSRLYCLGSSLLAAWWVYSYPETFLTSIIVNPPQQLLDWYNSLFNLATQSFRLLLAGVVFVCLYVFQFKIVHGLVEVLMGLGD